MYTLAFLRLDYILDYPYDKQVAELVVYVDNKPGVKLEIASFIVMVLLWRISVFNFLNTNNGHVATVSFMNGINSTFCLCVCVCVCVLFVCV